jgi:hypothetical protein
MIFTDGPDNAEAIVVALALAEHADWKTLSTVVGAETIAKWTKLCERTVRNRIQELIRDGYLTGRPVGRGRKWKLRELSLSWPVRHAGHGDSRPAPGAGHGGPWPVAGNAMTGMWYSHDRHPVHPISSEISLETSSPHMCEEDAPTQKRFEQIRNAYPRFTGRQDWLSAEHHARQRVEQEQATWPELLGAVERYAAYVAAGGVSGPQFVLRPGKFFSSADRPWAQSWEVPPTKAEARRDSNVQAGVAWLAQQEKHDDAPK